MKISRKLSLISLFSIAALALLAGLFFSLKESEVLYFRAAENLSMVRTQIDHASSVSRVFGRLNIDETPISRHLNEARVSLRLVQSQSIAKDFAEINAIEGQIGKFETEFRQLVKSTRFLRNEIDAIKTLHHRMTSEPFQTLAAKHKDSNRLYGNIRESLEFVVALIENDLFTDRIYSRFLQKFEVGVATLENHRERLQSRKGKKNSALVSRLSRHLSKHLKEALDRTKAIRTLSRHRNETLQGLASIRETTSKKILKIEKTLKDVRKAESEHLLTIALSSSGGLLLLLLLTNLGLAHSIVRPIRELQETLKENLDQPDSQRIQKIKVTSRSELADLTRTFNQLISRLQSESKRTQSERGPHLELDLDPLLSRAESIDRLLKRSTLPSLLAANDLLEKNRDQIGTYFEKDEKGKNLPDFYISLGNLLKEERAQLAKEFALFSQDLRTLSNQPEQFSTDNRTDLRRVISEIFRTEAEFLRSHRVSVKSHLADPPTLLIPSRKISQILRSLIQSAVQGFEATNSPSRELVLTLENDPDRSTLLSISHSAQTWKLDPREQIPEMTRALGASFIVSGDLATIRFPEKLRLELKSHPGESKTELQT